MTAFWPCCECGLPAEVIDGWTWHAPDGTTHTYHDTECPQGHRGWGREHQ